MKKFVGIVIASVALGVFGYRCVMAWKNMKKFDRSAEELEKAIHDFEKQVDKDMRDLKQLDKKLEGMSEEERLQWAADMLKEKYKSL